MAQTENVKTAKTANGNAPMAAKSAETLPPAAATEGAETAEKRSRGQIPTMPACILYRLSGRVHAAIHNPVDGASYIETGKGVGSAKGALEDSGFKLGTETLDGPDWLASKLPTGAELLGYASIKGFPLPKQSS